MKIMLLLKATVVMQYTTVIIIVYSDRCEGINYGVN